MKSNLQLHKLTKSELQKVAPQIIQLEPYWVSANETEWNAENFARELPGKFDLSFYATIDGNVVGYLIGSEAPERVGKLNKVIVHPEYRGYKVGSELWNSFVNQAREKGMRKLEFKVLPSNESAIGLYKKNGCLFSGMAVGSDKKSRYNVHYVFQPYSAIPHSKPTLDESDFTAVTKQMISGNLAHGSRASHLVSKLGVGVKKSYGVATNSGTNAIFIALKAAGVNSSSEVIMPSYVCGSILHAVEAANAIPIFADIGNGFNMTYESVKEKMSRYTKAIIAPHLFGHVNEDIEKMKTLEAIVIEDCAQSLGGSFNGNPLGYDGHISVFSFYPTKMASSSSGGIALTNDKIIYQRMEDLLQTDNRKQWGEAYSMKMDDVAAALALSQLEKVGNFVKARGKVAEKYYLYLSGSDFILPKRNDGVYSRYVIQHPEAQQVLANLNSRGINARRPVHTPLHRYQSMPDSMYPNSSKRYEQSISLPIYPSLTDEEIMDVAGCVLNWRQEKK